jgi:hypothetical protein
MCRAAGLIFRRRYRPQRFDPIKHSFNSSPSSGFGPVAQTPSCRTIRPVRTRGGFRYGGWPRPPTCCSVAAPGRTFHRMGQTSDDNPFSAHLNAATNYVTSITRTDIDEWQNSVLSRRAVDTVAALKTIGQRDPSARSARR